MQLRPYQNEAIVAVRKALNEGVKNPLACLPTGAGKSAVIATMAQQFASKGHQVTITVHTQELIAQLKGTYEAITGHAPAVYAASLNEKNVGQVTVAQIQSACNRPDLFSSSRIIIIDECDRIPMDGDGQYRSFLSSLRSYMPDLRTIGFTATPYRLSGGLVYGQDRPFDDMVYDARIASLMGQGYLCPLRSKYGATPDISGVGIRSGEFIAAELEAAVSDVASVKAGVLELIRWGKDRKAWLVFAAGEKHARMISQELLRYDIEAPVVLGNMPAAERKEIIKSYKEKKSRCLVGINVLSVGFDAPHIDLIGMMRPTNSPGMYYQQCGRGLRPSEGKTDCIILDMAGNIERHGPIDTLNDRIDRKDKGLGTGVPPMKHCPECSEMMYAGVRKCTVCGYEFPIEIAKNTAFASREHVLSEHKQYKVSRVAYGVHTPKEAYKPSTLRVSYFSDAITEPVAVEFVSFDKDAHLFAKRKALEWLRQIPLKDIPGKTLVVDADKVEGNGKKLTSVLEVVPFCVLLSPPTTIGTMPNPKNPKYRTVIARSWA